MLRDTIRRQVVLEPIDTHANRPFSRQAYPLVDLFNLLFDEGRNNRGFARFWYEGDRVTARTCKLPLAQVVGTREHHPHVREARPKLTGKLESAATWEHELDEDEVDVFGEVREGLRYVRSMPTLWISFAMLAAIGTLSYNFTVTLPLFVTDGLGSSGTVFTILYSIYSAGAVVSALIVADRSLVRMVHIVIGAAALGATMLLLAAVPSVGFAVPVVFLVGMASILYLTATTALVQVEGKPEMHGRVLSLQTVLMVGTTPVGAPLLGWMADTVGGRAPIVLGGVVALLTAAFGAVASRRYVHRQPEAGGVPARPSG